MTGVQGGRKKRTQQSRNANRECEKQCFYSRPTVLPLVRNTVLLARRKCRWVVRIKITRLLYSGTVVAAFCRAAYFCLLCVRRCRPVQAKSGALNDYGVPFIIL